MGRRPPASGWRATAFAVALFAITLNFLQPLVHAALMRDGARSALWTMFCNASPQEPRKDTVPMAAEQHECCLGLAHAAGFPLPSATFIAVEPIVTAARSPDRLDPRAPVGIRDGPHRPRGPPAFV